MIEFSQEYYERSIKKSCKTHATVVHEPIIIMMSRMSMLISLAETRKEQCDKSKPRKLLFTIYLSMSSKGELKVILFNWRE